MRQLVGQVLLIGLMAVMGFPLAARAAEPAGESRGVLRVDPAGHRILGLADGIPDRFRLKFVSVTVDQPIYWPNEEVRLKIAMPALPGARVTVNLQRKDAAPKDLGDFTLNDGGVLVETIMNGSGRRLEVGEYRVEVKTADGRFSDSAAFAVVEGSLGAVSFAYEWQQLTNPQALEESKAGWFLGNAAGVGARWGNGLNVKNELRVFNQPYDGQVTLKTRCMLPGCNGCEAGPDKVVTLEKGKLAAVLDVSSHSGPFELEVVTPKGNVRNLFGRSGHVERQVSVISSGFTNRFKATVAPYEKTVVVPGREIYILKEDGDPGDAFQLGSAITDSDGTVRVEAKTALTGVKGFRLVPQPDGSFAVTELKLGETLTRGQELKLEAGSPYTFVALGGWEDGQKGREQEKTLRQAWAMLFTPSGLKVKLETPKQGAPEQPIEVTVQTTDRAEGKPRSVWGLLEVFDNRVANRSPKDPLISATGDSFRDAAAGLVSWEDQTGYASFAKSGRGVLSAQEPGALPPPMPTAPSMSRAADEESDSFVAGGAPAGAAMPGAPMRAQGTNEIDSKAENPEAVREGEKKVVFCEAVKTDDAGMAKVSVTLPPQSGRCKARFVALSGFDYLEAVNDVDVGKRGGTVEISAPALVLKGAEVSIRVHAVCDAGAGKLKVSGAGLAKPVVLEVPVGGQEFTVPITGGGSGELLAELTRADGTPVDRRVMKIRDAGEFPVTFSQLAIADGNELKIPARRSVTVFANAGQLLKGMTAKVVTTMKSWFGHAEALSAAAAVDAMLLRAVAERIIDDDGLRSTIKADLEKAVKDLDQTFFDPQAKLIRPYPGLAGNPMWSVWVLRNLLQMGNVLNGHPGLKREFAATLKVSARLAEHLVTELGRRKISTEEVGLFTPGQQGVDLMPIVVDGKVVYRAITDRSVAEWYSKQLAPALDLAHADSLNRINAQVVASYDRFRFLRAFERTGPLFYLLLNAKALFIQKDPAFGPLFTKIARGMILTGDPGLLQGPAMLGGVYGAPQTVVKFLDLLITMAGAPKEVPSGVVQFAARDKPAETRPLGVQPLRFESGGDGAVLRAPAWAVVMIEEQRPLLLAEYLVNDPFFTVRGGNPDLTVGAASEIVIELAADRDPIDYYAVIALPSVLSLRQTDDILADYKGQLLYGQKTSGGERIQFVTVPFRGSRTMRLSAEGALPGRSPGYVMVRHQSNPAVIQTLALPPVTCRP